VQPGLGPYPEQPRVDERYGNIRQQSRRLSVRIQSQEVNYCGIVSLNGTHISSSSIESYAFTGLDITAVSFFLAGKLPANTTPMAAAITTSVKSR